jgi:acetyltransferase
VNLTLHDGRLAIIRAVAAEDAAAMRDFVRGLSPASRYFRFMMGMRELSDETLQRFTHPRPDGEAVLVAVSRNAARCEQIVGMAQYVADEDGCGCEFALVVGDNWQRRGLGYRLLAELTQLAMRAGFTNLHADVLAGNHAMLGLAEKTGCEFRHDPAAPFVLRLSRSFSRRVPAPGLPRVSGASSPRAPCAG